MARRVRPLTNKAEDLQEPLHDWTYYGVSETYKDFEADMKEPDEIIYRGYGLIPKRRETKAQEMKNEKKSMFGESTRASVLSEHGGSGPQSFLLPSVRSSVCREEERIRTATQQKKPLAFQVTQPSIKKLEVPETLVTSRAKLQGVESSCLYGKDEINKPKFYSDRAEDVRSLRKLSPEHKPTLQATGARPKTSQSSRTSSSMAPGGSKFAKSQTEKVKFLPGEQRSAHQYNFKVLGSRETFYGGAEVDEMRSGILKNPTKIYKTEEYGKDGAANRALSPPCLYCKGGHAFAECPQFEKHPHELRLQFIRKSGRCFRCLGEGHFSRECTSKHFCSICRLDHPRILHRQSWEESMEELCAMFNKKWIRSWKV